MRVELNGEPIELAEGATIADAVGVAGATEPRGVAVALEGEVIRRAEWDATQIRAGQSIEVVRAVQGG